MQTIINLLMQEQTSALANLAALGVGTFGAAVAAAVLIAGRWIGGIVVCGE
jgi:hypothetical protein